MHYHLIERNNPANPAAKKKWYAQGVKSGTTDIKELAKEIAGRSSLSRGDVESVLVNFLEVLPSLLKKGETVQLGEFASVRLSVSSEGVDDPADFHTKMMKPAKIIFTPSTELKTSLQDIHYERERK